VFKELACSLLALGNIGCVISYVALEMHTIDTASVNVGLKAHSAESAYYQGLKIRQDGHQLCYAVPVSHFLEAEDVGTNIDQGVLCSAITSPKGSIQYEQHL
jgi:hypothetical protein